MRSKKVLMDSWALVLAVFTMGCSTQKLSTENRLPARFADNDIKDGNGGPRGGGDRVAGEFMEYERIALAKMEAWSKKGKIKISEAELEKIRAVMPPNTRKNPKHIVTSEDRVCTTEGKLPSGECLNGRDERDVIKRPFAKPPGIIVGRKRWDEARNTPAAKESMAQHELRGIALSVPGKEFADERFDQTYEALNSEIKEWNAVVRVHLDHLWKMRLYDETNEVIDSGIFGTVKDTFIGSSTDYVRCAAATDEEMAKSELNRKRVERRIKRNSSKASLDPDLNQTCFRAIKSYERVITKNAVPSTQRKAGLLAEKVQSVYADWQSWVNGVYPPAWKQWLLKSMESYEADRKAILLKAHTPISRDQFQAVMNQKCPWSNLKNYRDVVVCYVNAGEEAATELYSKRMTEAVDQLIEAHQKAVGDVVSQVDPI